MTGVTRAPDVVDALVQAFTAAMPTVGVYDGPHPKYQHDRGLIVGWNPEGPAVVVETPRAAGWGNRRDETGFVVCRAFANLSAPNFPTLRVAVYSIVTAAEQVLVADRRLGGVCEDAHVAGGDLDQQQRGKGWLAEVSFTVQWKAPL